MLFRSPSEKSNRIVTELWSVHQDKSDDVDWRCWICHLLAPVASFESLAGILERVLRSRITCQLVHSHLLALDLAILHLKVVYCEQMHALYMTRIMVSWATLSNAHNSTQTEPINLCSFPRAITASTSMLIVGSVPLELLFKKTTMRSCAHVTRMSCEAFHPSLARLASQPVAIRHEYK